MSIDTALATFDAVANATAGVLVFIAWRAIKHKKVTLHKRLMIAAVVVSALFLTSYLLRHALYGPTYFTGHGATRVAYFTLLGTHTVLAALVPFLVLRALYLGLKRRFPSHRKIARWAFPVWAYVSVTGVLVYLALYHLPPAMLAMR